MEDEPICALETDDFDVYMEHSIHSCDKCWRSHFDKKYGSDGLTEHYKSHGFKLPSWLLPAEEEKAVSQSSENAESRVSEQGDKSGTRLRQTRAPLVIKREEEKPETSKQKPRPSFGPELPKQPDKKAEPWFKVREYKKMGMSKHEAKLKVIEETRKRIEQERLESGESINEKPKANVPKHMMPWFPDPLFLYKGHFSVLTGAEQKRFVAIEVAKQVQGKTRFRENVVDLQNFRQRTMQEREQFQKVVTAMVSKMKDVRHNMLPNYARKYILDRVMSRASYIKDLPATIFCSIDGAKKIPIYSNQLVVDREPPWLVLNSFLLQVGNPSRIKLPELQRKASLPKTTPDNKFPPQESTQLGVESDENVTKLIRTYEPQFVMSASTARLLICLTGLTHGQDWEIPINVKSVFMNGRPGQVVFLLKPLPPRKQTTMQKYLSYTKFALKAHVMNRKFDQSKIDKYKKEKEPNSTQTDHFQVAESMEDWTTEDDDDDVETFGVPSIKKVKISGQASAADSGSQKKDSPLSNQQPDINEDFEERQPLLIDVGESTETSPKRRTRQQTKKLPDSPSPSKIESSEAAIPKRKSRSSIPKESEDKQNVDKPESVPIDVAVVDDILAKMSSTFNTTAAPDIDANEEFEESIENSNDYSKPCVDGKQWQYKMWNLKEFNLLIRNNTDGIMRTSLQSKHGTINRPLPTSVLPKIEYFPEHGAQVLSENEWLHNMLTCQLKGSKVHVLVHLHSALKHYLGVTNFDDSHWKREKLTQERRQFVEASLRRFYFLLKDLAHLPRGNYLLQHQSGQDYFNLLTEAENDKSKGCDLKTKYDPTTPRLLDEQIDLPPFNERFFGIDSDVILTWHRIKGRAPATFLPRRDDLPPSIFGNAKKIKNKKSKSWKKNKKPQKRKLNESINDSNSAEL